MKDLTTVVDLTERAQTGLNDRDGVTGLSRRKSRPFFGAPVNRRSDQPEPPWPLLEQLPLARPTRAAAMLAGFPSQSFGNAPAFAYKMAMKTPPSSFSRRHRFRGQKAIFYQQPSATGDIVDYVAPLNGSCMRNVCDVALGTAVS